MRAYVYNSQTDPLVARPLAHISRQLVEISKMLSELVKLAAETAATTCASDRKAAAACARAQFEGPDVPQRKIDVPPGAGVHWPSTTDLTQEYIDTDYSTEEEKVLWAEYLLEAKKVVDGKFIANLQAFRELRQGSSAATQSRQRGTRQ